MQNVTKGWQMKQLRSLGNLSGSPLGFRVDCFGPSVAAGRIAACDAVLQFRFGIFVRDEIVFVPA